MVCLGGTSHGTQEYYTFRSDITCWLVVDHGRCFEPYGEDAQEYARATVLVSHSCRDEVTRLLHNFLYLDETTAVRPLLPAGQKEPEELPET